MRRRRGKSSKTTAHARRHTGSPAGAPRHLQTQLLPKRLPERAAACVHPPCPGLSGSAVVPTTWKPPPLPSLLYGCGSVVMPQFHFSGDLGASKPSADELSAVRTAPQIGTRGATWYVTKDKQC
eukprot:scaffold114539_cov19-Tisochrysis_lutea.AAC.1